MRNKDSLHILTAAAANVMVGCSDDESDDAPSDGLHVEMASGRERKTPKLSCKFTCATIGATGLKYYVHVCTGKRSFPLFLVDFLGQTSKHRAHM